MSKILFVVKFRLSENKISKSGSLPTSVLVNIDYETCSPLIFPTFFIVCFQLCYLRCRCRRECFTSECLRLRCDRLRLGLAPSRRPSSPSPSESGAVSPSLVFVSVWVWRRLAVSCLRLRLGLAPSCRPSLPSPSGSGIVSPSLSRRPPSPSRPRELRQRASCARPRVFV